jgi:hypothetical protein
MSSLRQRSRAEEDLGIHGKDEQEIIDMARYVIGALMGAAIGGLIGYIGKCGGSG